MYRLLDQVKDPADIKQFTNREKEELAHEIRHFLVDAVSQTGGHLASNLGVVELTIALHSVFDFPDDKVIWDVGHQCYVHKILTGRRGRFATLRQEGGLSGFPKTSESVYDSFNTGHSSTSISAALGMARARDLRGDKNRVIAVIGDGALTGGLAYEALSDTGHSKNSLIVILNDNEMSVSKNVGGISEYLSKIRTQPSYFKVKSAAEKAILKLPHGDTVISVMRKTKNSIKKLLMQQNIFEELGFTYLGPVDGHDIKKVSKMLMRAKNIAGPVLVHVCTRKGKGYEPAEIKPQNFHGIARFDTASGSVIRDKVHADYSAIFGRHLVNLARENDRVVAISPAMTLGSGLKLFARTLPERFFDVGIAEAHAVTSAAGLAISGFIPVVAVYSSFLQRAYDQIIHDVAMQNLHVVFCIDRAGVVGDDGETHQGVFDIAFLRHIPNMSLLAPSSFFELEQMLRYAVLEHRGPIAIRYPRGREQYPARQPDFVFGKSAVIVEGNDISILAVGNMLKYACEAASILKKSGIFAEVVSIRTIKPLDEQTILKTARKTMHVLTLEDGEIIGGVGEAIASLLMRQGIAAVFENRGYDDYVQQAKVARVHEKYGLDTASIVSYVQKTVHRERVKAIQ